jgi:hypothetical protein
MRRFAILLLLAAAAPVLASPGGGARVEARSMRDGGPRVVREADGSRRVDFAAGSVRLESPPRAVVEAIAEIEDGWLVVGVVPIDGGQELWIARGGARGAHELDPPGDRRAAWRDGPLPIADAGGLHGTAWLEGDAHDRYAVRWARWTGDGFDAPVTVSPPGPGSQLALAGAALADGRLLLVWSGYDGDDDEIWASIGDDHGWSAPRRLGGDNAVPDITPAVAADGRGAWVSWSRFDVESKQYRVALSRYDGRRFADALLVGGPGTLYPTFERLGDRLALLYRDARAGAWAIAEIDAADGRPGRRTTLEAPGSERPSVAAGDAGVTWRFAGRTTDSAWD